MARVLTSLTSLCELGLFQPMRIWELMSATLSFLYHPNIWIRQGMSIIFADASLHSPISGAAAFIAAAARRLPASDVWCILYPSLKHFLRSDIREVDERSMLIAMKPPVSIDATFFEKNRVDDLGSFRDIFLTLPRNGRRRQRNHPFGGFTVLRDPNHQEQALPL